MEKTSIGVITGSLRKGSYCKKIARVVSGFMPDTLEMVPVDINGLALYNQDFDDDGMPPPEWTDFRRRVEDLDGFLFITPEYNRSMPAALKNALDIASRPSSMNRWNDKPGAIISVTLGKLGAFGAYHALRQTLGFLNVHLLQQPEMYLGAAAELFDANDELVNSETRRFLRGFAQTFAEWALKIKAA